MHPSSSPAALRSGRLVACALGLLAPLGCAGNGLGLDENGNPIVDLATTEDGGRGDGGNRVAFRDLQAKIFTPLCSVHCHGGAQAPRGLQLDATNAYNLLVKVPSVEVPSLMRVSPGQPELSYLMVKLASVDPRRSGERMPRNGPPYLSEAQIKSVRTWILDGAQR